LGAPRTSNCRLAPKRAHYDALEADELWAFARRKSRKVRLAHAYCRESGGIAAFARGKRSLKAARRLRRRVAEAGVACGRFATDWRRGFLAAFKGGDQKVGKAYACGMEGNNCRLRRRARRALRRTRRFSKKILYHLKAFSLAFFFINYGHV
jgi:IS1 family transposase